MSVCLFVSKMEFDSEQNLMHVTRHRLSKYTAAGLLSLLVLQPETFSRTLAATRTSPKRFQAPAKDIFVHMVLAPSVLGRRVYR